MDIGSDIMDGFIEASFGGASIKTDVVKCIAATKTCYWYEELRLPVVIPNVTNKVILNLWD